MHVCIIYFCLLNYVLTNIPVWCPYPCCLLEITMKFVFSSLIFSFSYLSDTDEELKEWKTKFEERIAMLENKISKLEREMNDKETESSFLKQSINDYIWEISKLQTEAEVISIELITFDILNVKFISTYSTGFLSFAFRLICP